MQTAMAMAMVIVMVMAMATKTISDDDIIELIGKFGDDGIMIVMMMISLLLRMYLA